MKPVHYNKTSSAFGLYRALSVVLGEIGRACVNVGPRGEVPTYTSSIGLDWITARWGCPTPTPEDLAWLRGAK